MACNPRRRNSRSPSLCQHLRSGEMLWVVPGGYRRCDNGRCRRDAANSPRSREPGSGRRHRRPPARDSRYCLQLVFRLDHVGGGHMLAVTGRHTSTKGTPTEQVGPCREGRRKSGSHLTPCWREQDSNPRSPDLGELSCRAHYADRPEGARQPEGIAARSPPRTRRRPRVRGEPFHWSQGPIGIGRVAVWDVARRVAARPCFQSSALTRAERHDTHAPMSPQYKSSVFYRRQISRIT
jgi:hypothetical protein